MYVRAKWGSFEISKAESQNIPEKLMPIEIGQSPFERANGSGDEDFWAHMSKRIARMARLMPDS
eukprot:5385137-Pyramimonas_sp.AAC.1